MAEGRVEQALSATVTGRKVHQPPRSASLESLVGFAANPVPLGALNARMRLHELMAEVRSTMNVRRFPTSSKPAVRDKLEKIMIIIVLFVPGGYFACPSATITSVPFVLHV